MKGVNLHTDSLLTRHGQETLLKRRILTNQKYDDYNILHSSYLKTSILLGGGKRMSRLHAMRSIYYGEQSCMF